MTRSRLRGLGVRDLQRLPTTCPSCVLGSGRTPGLERSGSGTTWAGKAEADWGFCGIGMFHVEQIVGYLLLTSPLHVPRLGPQSGYGLNPDAAVIMSLRVLPELAQTGIGRQLVQAAAARLARTPLRALEVRATYGPGTCAVPAVSFLEAVGFEMTDPHPLHPRLRLELSRTIRWSPEFRTSIERLLVWVRPLPPEPAGRAQPRHRCSIGSRA